MNWRQSIHTHRKLILVIVGIIVVLIVLFVFGVFRGKTYVRIVDRADDNISSATAPGADINAVEVHLVAKGKSIFASEVASSSVPATLDGVTNTYANPATALGNPADDTTASYVSLAGGEIVVLVPSRLKTGDQLIVHEIGSSEGIRAEHFDVYTSTRVEGPWKHRGTGSGPTTITIE